ncbi:MAG TPA: hypothetical protein VHP34_08555 [Alphaproteobacteria bacterium]|nr:hypothetical protein [Alphaproteobacteria bacterium]
MAFWNKKNKNGDKPKKESLADKFRRASGRMRRLTFKDLGKMTHHTLSDLRQPKEAGGLVIAIIIPGGMFGWFAYRFDKFRRHHTANDNHPPKPDALPKPVQNQPPAKPKGKHPPPKPKPPQA